MIRRKNFLGHVQKFLQGFQFRINIRIEPLRTASIRFNPQRKTASTLIAYRMTFIVTIRIWSGWKWAEWVVIYATVTHNQISNRVHTELKPYRDLVPSVSTQVHKELKTYRPSYTRIVTLVNSWGFWGLRYGGENILVVFNIFARLKPYRNPF
jgi:hypothetical protein